MTIIEMKVNEVLQLDGQFQENDGRGNVNFQDKDFSTFKILKSKSRIMISAPHSVKHIREGEILPQDLLTGGLALYLGKRLNLSVIYSTSYKVGDPNFDENDNSEYKQVLAKYIKENDIKFLIDLHGCRSFRDFSIELGTGGEGNPNLLGNGKILKTITESLNNSLKSYIKHTKKTITENTIFSAGRETTVSSFISKECKIPSIQVEINKKLRDINSPQNISLLINSLENMVGDLIAEID